MSENCIHLKIDAQGRSYCIARGTAYCCLPALNQYWIETELCPRYEMKDTTEDITE